MAGNSPETRTIEQEADDIVTKLQKKEPVTQPISPEVKALAEKKISALQEEDQAGIRTALNALRTDTENAQAQIKNKEEIKASIDNTLDSNKIKALKIELEKETQAPINPVELSKVLDRLNGEKDLDNRAVITSYVWSKLNTKGYIISVENTSISVTHTSDREGAVLLKETLQSYIGKNILTLTDIQRAMVVGTASFGRYLETQKINPKNASTEGYIQFLIEARGIDLSKGRTVEQQIRLIQSSKASQEEKAVLMSYVNGGLRTYSITPEVERQLQISKISTEMQSSPVMKSAEKAVANASGGGAKAEKQRMQESGEELTWNSFLDNPMRAITKYPWTSIGLIIGSIWQFGFGKTLLGLFGGFIGYNVADEWGLVDKMKKKEKTQSVEPETSKKGVKKQSKTPVEIPPSKSIDKAGLSGGRLEATKRVEGDSELMSGVDTIRKSQIQKKGVEIGDIADYMAYINNELQERKIGDIINPSADFQYSIFSDDQFFDKAGKNNLNTIILKRILRVYLGADKRTAEAEQNMHKGEKEKNAFVAKYKSVFDNKDATLKDLIDSINK